MATRPGGIATRVTLWPPKPSNFRRPNRSLRGALRLEASKSLCFARFSGRRGRGGPIGKTNGCGSLPGAPKTLQNTGIWTLRGAGPHAEADSGAGNSTALGPKVLLSLQFRPAWSPNLIFYRAARGPLCAPAISVREGCLPKRGPVSGDTCPGQKLPACRGGGALPGKK